MAAAAEQPEGPWPFARMAASSLVDVSTYTFLVLPCPADKGPTARPFGIASPDPSFEAAIRNEPQGRDQAIDHAGQYWREKRQHNADHIGDRRDDGLPVTPHCLAEIALFAAVR